MKNMLLLIFLSLFISISIKATTVNGRFNVLVNDGTNYVIKLQINTDTGVDDMGTATIVFNYRSSDLSIPADVNGYVNVSNYTYHNFSGNLYSTATVSRPSLGQLWLNIELNVNNSGTVVAQAPGDWTDVVTITFTTTNAAGNSDLTWQTLNSNWSIYDGDNSTKWTTGTFTNLNTHPLPVELSSFSASVSESIVNLKWQTKTEVNNYGFEIERKVISKSSQLNNWNNIGFVQGKGNSNSPSDYSFIDKNAVGETKFLYRLKQIDNDGKYEYSDEVEVSLVPNQFNLYQNYPNPFNPETNIRFALSKSAKVNLIVYNLVGERVSTLIDEEMEAGYYDIPFNASNFSSGVYLYRLTAENFVQTKKMTLLR